MRILVLETFGTWNGIWISKPCVSWYLAPLALGICSQWTLLRMCIWSSWHAKTPWFSPFLSPCQDFLRAMRCTIVTNMNHGLPDAQTFVYFFPTPPSWCRKNSILLSKKCKLLWRHEMESGALGGDAMPWHSWVNLSVHRLIYFVEVLCGTTLGFA